jgi:hypothetical protein
LAAAGSQAEAPIATAQASGDIVPLPLAEVLTPTMIGLQAQGHLIVVH